MHEAMTTLYRHWDTVLNPGGYFNRAALNGCREHARAAMLDDTLYVWLGAGQIYRAALPPSPA